MTRLAQVFGRITQASPIQPATTRGRTSSSVPEITRHSIEARATA